MIKPLGDRVLIRPDSKEMQTKSGIVLPSAKKDKPSMTGVVLDFGPEVDPAASLIKVGDHVIFAEYAFETYETADEDDQPVKLQIGKAEDVLAIIVSNANQQ